VSKLRDWARLDARWYEDPVLRAVAKKAPAAFVMWPVLVGMAKAQSHVDDNPDGIVRVSLDDLARACCCTQLRAAAAIEALKDGEFVKVDADRVGLVRIRLLSFRKWQTPRKSAAEHAANKRWRTSRENVPLRQGEVDPASGSRPSLVMPDRDEDIDRDESASQPHARTSARGPLPPSPRSVGGQIRAAQRDLGSHVSQVIVSMIARRNSDAERLLTEREEFDGYWRPACELLDEFGPQRLRMAANRAGEQQAVRIGFLATVCKADQRVATAAAADNPDLAQSDWAGYTGTTATAPTGETAA
jgi:hypothetical protein